MKQNNNQMPYTINDIYQFNNHIIDNQDIYTYYDLEAFYKILPITINDFNKNFNNISSFINDVGEYVRIDNNTNTDLASIIEDNDDNSSIEIYTNSPLFVKHTNTIKVPSKVEYALRRHIPKCLLKDIHPDIDVSIDLCLLFTTQLTSTYCDSLGDNKSEGWKALKSEYLRKLFSYNPLMYKKIITALKYPLKKGAILECDHEYEIGVKSYNYRFGEGYIKKGIVSYQLKTTEAIELLSRYNLRIYTESVQNPICKNLMEFYNRITLPTIEQIKIEARRLIKVDYETKKGKKLIFLNKHTKEYFTKPEEKSFVEVAIKIYQYLTDDRLIFPESGSFISGGRVVDSFTLMPSWIRRMIKVEGKTQVQCDYSCLHPNIAIALYGGKQDFLTHSDLQERLGIDIKAIKIEHLSFFNKNLWQMKQSPLYNYYMEHEPTMMQNIINEKRQYGYKVTSQRLFKAEVEIMSDAIQKLNKEGIYVGYVYDELFCHPKVADRVKQIMDETVLKHGVKTRAKMSNGKKHEPIVEYFNEIMKPLPITYGESTN